MTRGSGVGIGVELDEGEELGGLELAAPEEPESLGTHPASATASRSADAAAPEARRLMPPAITESPSRALFMTEE